MALELKIISPSEEGFVKQIVWNADEIAEYVAGRVGYYKNLVYTDDQIFITYASGIPSTCAILT